MAKQIVLVSRLSFCTTVKGCVSNGYSLKAYSSGSLLCVSGTLLHLSGLFHLHNKAMKADEERHEKRYQVHAVDRNIPSP